jgi:hypothetical protein
MIRWQQGWHEFDIPDKEGYFLREFQWEIQENPNHPLHAKEARIVGWRRGYDDFILYLPGEKRYAYVHLTWNRETHPTFPYCQALDDIDAINRFLEHGDDDGGQEMDMKARFPNLSGICGCYFHQDWDMDDPTAEAVVRRYMRDADPQEVQRVAAEIDDFLRIEMTEEERRAVLDKFGCEYYPPGDELTYSEWLRQVHDILTGKK